jgi:hypothetical protein
LTFKELFIIICYVCFELLVFFDCTLILENRMNKFLVTLRKYLIVETPSKINWIFEHWYYFSWSWDLEWTRVGTICAPLLIKDLQFMDWIDFWSTSYIDRDILLQWPQAHRIIDDSQSFSFLSCHVTCLSARYLHKAHIYCFTFG